MAGMPQVQKGEIHQLNLRRGLTSDAPEYLAMDV